MKKRTVALLMALVLVLGIAVGGTIAWITTYTEPVVNTFTIGQLNIELDEAPVDANGKETSGERVKANTYTLLPGGDYDKDPTVTVKGSSAACWLFVTVDNQIAAIEDATTTADQMTAQGWKVLKDASGADVKLGNATVWYYDGGVASSAEDQEFVLFENFHIKTGETKETMATYQGKSITVKAYAIQKDTSIADAYAAWVAAGWTA